MPKFTLTEDHIKLIRSSYVNWNDDAYDGAPMVDIKRPYGNSDVVGDVYEIVSGREWDEDADGEMPEDIAENLLTVHEQTATALQIILCTGEFVAGVYETTRMYDSRSWARIEDNTKGVEVNGL